jgi:hypothetical protein
MKLVRQIVIALGLLAAFICLTVFSSTEYSPSHQGQADDLMTAGAKTPLVNNFFTGLERFFSVTDKIPLLKSPLATTTITGADIKTANDLSDQVKNNLEKTDLSQLGKANIKQNGSKINVEIDVGGLASTTPSDFFDRIKKALSGDWSRSGK